jgi:predicted DNA-binding antitoxin AbrB/MazE fold protein
MTKTVKVIYEDNVLKPIEPIKGITEHERVLVIICSHPIKKGLRELVGTLTHEEAEAMQKVIDEEFEKIEAQKDRSSDSRK